MTWTSRRHKDALKTRQWLAEAAGQLGFDQLGITTPDAVPLLPDRLQEFILSGRHGHMTWLAEKADRRAAPAVLWPHVQSIILLGMNYGPDMDPLARLEDSTSGVISVYAGHRDYHDVIKGRLKQLGQQLVARAGGDIKVFVDTAPVAEKPLAEAAGLGWQGKHTNLVSRQFGSWLFLGALFSTLLLPADHKEGDHCGSCQACLDACPTKAFPAPYQLDARRCISYLTIEHHGPIPRELRPAMGNRIYGCDDCLAVCPWNRFAQQAHETAFHFRDDLRAPKLAALVQLDDAAFRKLFSGSPVKRIGRDRFVRNVLIAIGNSGEASLTNVLVPRLSDDSAVVRGTAVWALGRLAPDQARNMAAARAQADADETVEREWQAVTAR